MDRDASMLAGVIGARVKAERQTRNWTLDTLAEAAGVSRRMVINVEQGVSNPSVGTLLRISGALGVGLPALVEPPQRKPVRVTRHGEGSVLWSGHSGGRGTLVAATEPPDIVELWDWVLEPGEQHDSEPHTPGTRELLQVLTGTLKLEIAADVVDLDTGDAIVFPGDVSHAYANASGDPVRLSLAVFEPGVGSRSRAAATHA